MKSPKRSSNILTRKWRQFWCLHKWCKGLPVDLMYGKGYLYRYHCTICEKVIYKWTGEEPISGVLPESPWKIYKKDPYSNMSPPIIRKD